MSKFTLILSILHLNNFWICLRTSNFFLFCNRRAVRNRKSPGCKDLDKRLAQPWRLISRQGIPDVGCTLVSGLHVHLTAVLRWVRPTSPDEPAFLWLNPSAYRVYDRIWACPASTSPWRSTIRTLQPVLGTLARRVFHELGQRTPHSYRWRVPGASRNWIHIVNKANFVAGECGNSPLRIQGPAVGQRDRPSRV